MGNSMQSLLIHSGSIYEEGQEQGQEQAQEQVKNENIIRGSTPHSSTNINYEENKINDKNQLDKWLEYVNAW